MLFLALREATKKASVKRKPSDGAQTTKPKEQLEETKRALEGSEERTMEICRFFSEKQKKKEPLKQFCDELHGLFENC